MTQESNNRKPRARAPLFGSRRLSAQLKPAQHQGSCLAIGSLTPNEPVVIEIIAVQEARLFGLLAGQQRAVYRQALRASRDGELDLPVALGSGQYEIIVQRNRGQTEYLDIVVE